ncbi:ferrochelatase [Inmirania thermothiophila]|uniref:Ferrochelatase n=1 Tax=Inmirania thermothiophila TaxID=1750597 RepID=A0A3N1Y684_9GAMM|nr:ferrochelatase [Inmirania thermothiophila]ROR34295.1 ferrochelatase [Inmirania thermothiophila]
MATPADTAVLLTNLGSPAAPTPAAVRRYLGEFLADPRIVDLPRWLWLPILHGIVLRVRPRRTVPLYRGIWREDGAPLVAVTRRQAEGVAARLAAAGLQVQVAVAMRYGEPGIAETVDRLLAAGVRRLLVLPLYPQYSATTVASTFDALAAALAGRPRLPELHLVAGYHAEAGYLDALAASVREAWDREGRAGHLLFSFHGLPRRYAAAGDPYPVQCRATAAAVAARLGLAPQAWSVAFQSRFGPGAWLEPATEAVLAELPARGVRTLQVLCPGFAADCLETLEEIAVRGRETFLAAGGERFGYVPALNDRADHLDFLAALCARRLRAWAPPC